MTQQRSTNRPYAADDPVALEVRAIRHRLWKEGGKTVNGYLSVMNELTRKRTASLDERPKLSRRKSA